MTRGVLALAATAFACGACVHPATVERAYGGDVVQGRYVPPEAYAAFLRGALAEASGKVDDAVSSYREAARDDPASPEQIGRAHV